MPTKRCDPLSSPTAKRIDPTPEPFRVTRVAVKRSDAIDQIKFTYSDGADWKIGHDGGNADKRELVLTEGEYITSVTHEQFRNYRSAAAAVEFTTNKRRSFGYFPRALATRRADQQTTMVADPGHEIIALRIKRGTLEGIVQQLVPSDEAAIAHPKTWFVVAASKPKEDHESNQPGNYQDTIYSHYHDLSEAKAAYHVAKGAIISKVGRSAVLIDAIKSKVLLEAGNSAAVAACRAAAMADGYFSEKEESDVSVYDTVVALCKVLADRKDTILFLAVLGLLTLSSYLEVYTQSLTGAVLAMGASGERGSLERHPVPLLVCATLLDCGTDPSDANGRSHLLDESDLRRAMVLGFVLMKVIERLVYVFNVYVHHNACELKNFKLSSDIFTHVLSMDQSFFDTHSVSEIRGGMNVHALSNLICWNLPYILTKYLKLTFDVAFLYNISPELCALAVTSLLVIKFGVLEPLSKHEIVINKVGRKLQRMSDETRDESFVMINLIKVFGSEKRHTDEFNDATRRQTEAVNRKVALRCIREWGYGVLRVMTYGLALYYATTVSTNLSPADLTSFFLIFGSFQEQFGSIKWHTEVLVRELPDITRFLDLMNTKTTMKSGPCRRDIDGDIKFSGVNFEYPSRPGQPVLVDLDLTIQRNQVTAIVGGSGAGKSTISKLIGRMYDPSSGAVTADGVDLREFDEHSLRSQIAVVPQLPQLFAMSIGENIAYGAGRPVTQSEIEAAAKLANCHDFITRFRGGYDTYAGSDGGALSGGEKQRIAIARAAIRNPRILVLDEATSALDAKSEAVVQEALEKVMRGRTTIVIAHRLSTIRTADEIICLKHGKVSESGTHEELMMKNGEYRALVTHQLGGDGGTDDQKAEHLLRSRS